MLKIDIIHGDIFTTDADLITITTNSVGVMGKGLALSFKNKFPEISKNYIETQSKYCDFLHPPLFYDEENPIWCMFPTKIHWKNPSKYDYVWKNLETLVDYCTSNKETITKIAMPFLGCGNGKLDKKLVYGGIRDYFTQSLSQLNPNFKIEIYH